MAKNWLLALVMAGVMTEGTALAGDAFCSGASEPVTIRCIVGEVAWRTVAGKAVEGIR